MESWNMTKLLVFAEAAMRLLFLFLIHKGGV